MTSSTVVDAPSKNPGPRPAIVRAARRLGTWLRHGVSFLALAAVVLSLGLEAGATPAANHNPTFSEIALEQARNQARDLASEARLLAVDAPGTGAAELLAQAEGLRSQAALLTDAARKPATAAPSVPSGPGPGTVDSYLQALAGSARSNLESARRADSGTSRLLAATGAAQQVWVERAGKLYGIPAAAGTSGQAVPEAEALPGADRHTDPSRCPDPGSEPAGGTTAAPDAAAALTAAVNAELGTAYAYEVALAQDPSAAKLGRQWRSRVQAHTSHGKDALAYLTGLCLPAVPPSAAYRVDAGFLRSPAAALPALEQQFPAVYANLVALSDGDLRAWAVARLAAVSAELYVGADTVPATPGVDAVPDDLPWN